MRRILEAPLRGASLALVLAACGGETSAGAIRLQPANPRAVSLQLDSARSTTEAISAKDGGVVFAEAADGTRYVLTIPEGALLSDERVTLTPITAVRDLPLSGGFVAAVRMKPEGLRFLKPASLEIELAKQVPAAEQIAFATEGHGSEFHLYPTALSSSAVAIPIMHFSAVGVGRGSMQDVSTAAQHAPTSGESQFEQRRQALIAEERTRQLHGGSEDVEISAELGRELMKISREEYEAEVRPRLVSATSDDKLAEVAVYRFFAWARWIALFAGEDALTGEFRAQQEDGMKLVVKVVENAFEKAYQRCTNDAAITPHVQRMLQLARFAQLLGMDILNDVAERIDKCARFELRFESQMVYRTKAGEVSGSDQVEATVPLHYDFTAGTFTGTAPLTFVSSQQFQRTELTGMGRAFGSCDLKGIGTTNGTLTVNAATINLNPTQDTTTRLTVALTPADLKVRVRASNCTLLSKASEGKSSEEESMWLAGWRDQHRKDGDASTSDSGLPTRWIIDDWEPVGRAIVARKIIHQVVDNVIMRSTEDTKMELRHTPAR